MTALVADASAIVDLLVGARTAPAIRRALEQAPEIHVPEHFHVEAISALRGLLARGDLDLDGAQRSLAFLGELRTVRHPTWPLMTLIWGLRHSLTAYDAAYLALAEAIDARLVTTDRGLGQVADERGRLVALA